MLHFETDTSFPALKFTSDVPVSGVGVTMSRGADTRVFVASFSQNHPVICLARSESDQITYFAPVNFAVQVKERRSYRALSYRYSLTVICYYYLKHVKVA